MKKLAVVLFVLCAMAIPAKAELLPYIDKLDLQFGPGYGLSKFKPLEIEKVFLATAQLYKRSHFELRLGGLMETSRKALVFGIGRDLLDLQTRLDEGEEKSVWPTVGLWISCELDRRDDGSWRMLGMLGVNAVLVEY